MINIIETIVAVILIILILLQERSSGLSSVLGGSEFSFSKRRGLERIIFYFTYILVAVFIILAIVNLVS